MAIRHRSRHLHATMFDKVATELTALGWAGSTVNFSADPVKFIDFQPDERGEEVTGNTVAVSLGDALSDTDEELGALWGGLRSAWYPVFIDVYMAEQPLAEAICDDIRAILDTQIFPLIDQITSTPSAETIEVQEVNGPTRPLGTSTELFKRYWRIMKVGVQLYYNTD